MNIVSSCFFISKSLLNNNILAKIVKINKLKIIHFIKDKILKINTGMKIWIFTHVSDNDAVIIVY